MRGFLRHTAACPAYLLYGTDSHGNYYDHSACHDLKTSHDNYLNDYDRLADYRHDNGHDHIPTIYNFDYDGGN